jgi:hypothetical protein
MILWDCFTLREVVFWECGMHCLQYHLTLEMSKETDAMINYLYLLIDEVDKVGFSEIVHHIE